MANAKKRAVSAYTIHDAIKKVRQLLRTLDIKKSTNLKTDV